MKCPGCGDDVVGVKMMIPTNRIMLIHPQVIPGRECFCIFVIDNDPRVIRDSVESIVKSLEIKP